MLAHLKTEKFSGGILKILRRNDEKSNLNFPLGGMGKRFALEASEGELD